MITLTWEISQLDCHQKLEDQAGVVFAVYWFCNGTDGTYSSSVYSICGIPFLDNSFTPYNELTKDQVLEWIWQNGVDKASVEADVKKKIDYQANPPVLNLTPPWAN